MRTPSFVIALLLVAPSAYLLGLRHGLSKLPPRTAASVPSTNELSPPRIAENNVTPVQTPKPENIQTNAPFAKNMTNAERGYKIAQENLQAALQHIESLPVTERMGFITGVMSFVAKHHAPADALKFYEQVPEAQKPNALRALVAEWVYSRSPLDDTMRHTKREGTFTISGSRLGLEVELSSMLASAQPDLELTTAWLDAFSSHSSRSEILRMLSSRLPRGNPEAVLDRTENWTNWEKERVTRSYLFDWAQQSPKEAWAWYQANREQIPPEFSSSLITPWAMSDPQGAKSLLQTLDDPTQRQIAIPVIGKVLAQRDTDDAITWAESFPDPAERAAAQQAVYDGAPRGIGAVLDYEKGFPKLRAIVPGSPLEGTAAKPGDRFVEVRTADGARHELYGRDFAAVVDMLRGEPGSEITLRVLRQNDASGQLEEQFLPIRRGQLYLNEKALKN
jgi:hypothetical protein